MKYLVFLALAAIASAQVPYGIDVSDYQPDVDWTTVVDNGISFVYIKATEGTGKDFPAADHGCHDRLSLQIISLLPSATSTSGQLMPVSSVAVTILPTLTSLLAPSRLITSWLTGVRCLMSFFLVND